MKILNKQKYVFLLAGLLVLGFVVIGVQGCQGKKAAEKGTYYCPMHPQITSDRPGECPICYMKLVKKESALPAEHDHGQELGSKNSVKENFGAGPAGYAGVSLTAQKQQLINIKSTQVKKINLKKTIRAVGSVAHDPELYQAQAEYIQAVKALKQAQQGVNTEITEQAQRLVEATVVRLKHQGLNDALIKQMENLQEPDHSLLYIHEGGDRWIYAQVYEYELPFIQVGQTVQVEAPALGGWNLIGGIMAIDPIVDEMTRTTRVRVKAFDEQGVLRPAMYVHVLIDINLGEGLTVPSEAVFDTGERKVVFIDRGQGVFEPKEVVAGLKTKEFYQITSGLQEGDRVVVNGNFLIDSESRLKAALEGTAMEQGSSPEGSHIGH